MKTHLQITTPDGMIYETATDWIAIRWVQKHVEQNPGDIGKTERLMERVTGEFEDGDKLIKWVRENLTGLEVLTNSRIVGTSKFNIDEAWSKASLTASDTPSPDANQIMNEMGMSVRLPLGVLMNALLPVGEMLGGITVKVPSGDHSIGIAAYRGPESVCASFWNSLLATSEEAVKMLAESATPSNSTKH